MMDVSPPPVLCAVQRAQSYTSSTCIEGYTTVIHSGFECVLRRRAGGGRPVSLDVRLRAEH